ncbi:MAG: glycosyltransferase family 4 protein [Acidobacteria bacterium]|nr:glycosyltransferase family 4 protein [Acidobacteriota bacterium]
MKILHISSARTFSGTERHIADLTRELDNRGHENYVGLRPTSQWRERIPHIKDENLLYVSIRNSFGMFSAKKIAKFVNERDIDIIHTHVARDYLAATSAARLAGARLVLTRHMMGALKPYYRVALRNIDALIAVSSPVRDQLHKFFDPSRVHLISNGIRPVEADEERRETAGREFRALHGIPRDAALVVTLGELKVSKGQRDFVLAAQEAARDAPDVHFVIAGIDHTPDKRFRRELRRLVKVFGMEERFLWLDWLDDLTPLLSAADIFVSPSHEESFGLAILDAMFVGLPVIATETDGARELIADTNALVPVRDPLALAATIKHYIDHPQAAERLGNQLRHAAEERFSITTMIDRTEALYGSILGA